MLKHTFLAISLCAAVNAAAAEWQHTSPNFDRTGQVTLKTLSGVTSQLSNTGQQGLQSSASPTVLSVSIGGAQYAVNKVEVVHFLPSQFSYFVSNGQNGRLQPIATLSQSFDLQRTYIDVEVIRHGHYCDSDCNQWHDQLVSYGFKLLDDKTLSSVKGPTELKDGMFAYTMVWQEPEYRVRVIELKDGYVARKQLELNYGNNPQTIEFPENGQIFYSFANGKLSNCGYGFQFCSLGVAMTKGADYSTRKNTATFKAVGVRYDNVPSSAQGPIVFYNIVAKSLTDLPPP